MHIWALSDPKLQEVALAIDHCKPKKTNEQISLPEIYWARDELEKLRDGKDSKLCIIGDDLATFEERFERLERFFQDPINNLDIIRRPPLRLGQQVYEFVFQIPCQDLTNPREFDRFQKVIKNLRKSGFDTIFAEDADHRRYVALHERGRLKLPSEEMEAVLLTPLYDQVRIFHIEDVNNSWGEGCAIIPDMWYQLADGLFSGQANPIAEIIEKKAEGDDVEIVMPKMNGKAPPGLTGAVGIALGVVGFGAMLATIPEAAGFVAGISVLGSLWNGFAGHFRKQDLFYILNQAGVQLGREGVPLSALTP